MEDELTYEAQVGIAFKTKLSISPSYIEWKGIQWPTDSICRIRWGSRSFNGNTEYLIWFGDKTKDARVRLLKRTTYENFTKRL